MEGFHWLSQAEGFCEAVGAWPRWGQAGDQAHVPGLLLAALPRSFRPQPAPARPKGSPGHGHRCTALGVCPGGRHRSGGTLGRLGQLPGGAFPQGRRADAGVQGGRAGFSPLRAATLEKVWSINLLERLNEEVKRRTRVVGIFPNDASITLLVGAMLLEQDEHWQLEGRRMLSADSMAAIPSLKDLPAVNDSAA